MFRTFKEVLHYLYSTLPMYQRVGAVAFKKDLTNTLALCRELGDPHRAFRSIHIGGTNGKGSSSHMLAAMLQAAGYRIGLYTSPHLKSFTERIRINGKEVSEKFVTDWVNRMKPVLDIIKPSFFETTVAMAFDYFAREKVDLAVIEVGLGGRLDSTNVITPLISLITNIGYDHMDMLGDTLDKIAFEKAGIIKADVPAVIGQRHPETDPIFIRKALEVKAPLYFATDRYAAEGSTSNLKILKEGEIIFSNLSLSLKGIYQKKNIPGVMMVTELLADKEINISSQAVITGLQQAAELTGLKGRWQILSERPRVVCDIAHNEDGIREVVQMLEKETYNQLFIILGMVADKDHDRILNLLPRDARYFFCQASIPRALPASELALRASERGLNGEVIPDVNHALVRAFQLASPDDLIFVGGSTFVVAELNQL